MNHLEFYRAVQDRLVELPLQEANPTSTEDEPEAVECRTFDELLGYFRFTKETKVGLHLTEEIEQVLATILAVILSTTRSGAQLGLRVIGPAGTVKSTLVECCSQSHEFTYPTDKFTGIISGHSKTNSHLAEKMCGKCLIITEADTMDQLPNKDVVESEIRAAMTSNVIRSDYRNNNSQAVARTAFSVIKCGTEAMRINEDTQLGSRFVDIQLSLPTDKETEGDILDAAIGSQMTSFFGELEQLQEGDTSLPKKLLIERTQGVTKGFLQAKRERLFQAAKQSESVLTREQLNQIKNLAKYIAFCRTRVKRGKHDSLKARPKQELPTRLSEHLCRLGICLAAVLEENPTGPVCVTGRVLDILKKIAVDTSHGFQQEIITLLFQSDHLRTGLPLDLIHPCIGLGRSQTSNVLRDLQELNIIQSYKEPNGQENGRHAHYKVLTPELKDTIKGAFG